MERGRHSSIELLTTKCRNLAGDGAWNGRIRYPSANIPCDGSSVHCRHFFRNVTLLFVRLFQPQTGNIRLMVRLALFCRWRQNDRAWRNDRTLSTAFYSMGSGG
ncbi:hypothetical protein D3C78_1093060 [compost metagenome]